MHAKDLLGVPRDTYGQVKVRDLVHEVLAVPEAAGLAVVLVASCAPDRPRWRS